MRLPPLDSEDLDAEQRAVLEAINAGPRGAARTVGMIGPYGVWVRAPAIGHAVQALGAAARFDTSLSQSVMEVAICTVGAFHQARFEFAAHARLAAAAGIDAAVIERLRLQQDPQLEGDEALAWQVAHALLHQHRLDDSLYARATDRFGETGLIELVTVIGYYVLVSYTLNAFDVDLLDGMTDPFP